MTLVASIWIAPSRRPNLDGITIQHELLVLQNALPAAGLATITAAELQAAVPEPATVLLALVVIFVCPLRTRKCKMQNTK